MKTIALVTARSGSKGLPDKNIREIAGHTLLEWSIGACKRVECIDHVFLSTDSEKYAELGKSSGAEVPFLRPEHLARDMSTDLEVFQHFVEWMISQSMNYQSILHIRPTTPLRDPKVIEAAIEKYSFSIDRITSLRSVQEMSESAYKAFEVSDEGFLKSIISGSTSEAVNAPRQSFPKTYTANGYIDIVKTALIKDENQFHGSRIMSFETPATVEIDSEHDLIYARWKVEQDLNLHKRIFEAL